MSERAQTWQGRAMALLLLAILMRGLIPSGWMPATGTDRIGAASVGLIICSSTGATSAPDGSYLPGQDQAPASAGHSPCALSSPGAFLLPTAFPLFFAFLALLCESTPPTGPPAAVASPRDHIHPPAQAPPTLR